MLLQAFCNTRSDFDMEKSDKEFGEFSCEQLKV